MAQEIKEFEGYFKGENDLSLFYRIDEIVAKDNKAAIVVVHGLGEHSGRYHHLRNALLPQGYAIYGYDQRGHGKSAGIRGHVDTFDDLILDLKKFIDLVKEKTAGKKLFLLGHSMGGLVAATYAIRFPQGLTGVILSAPALKFALDVPKIKEAAGRLMSHIFPALTLENEIDPNLISHDHIEVERYKNDPLVHSKISTRFYVEFTRSMAWALDNAYRLELPSLMMNGTGDKIISYLGCEEFYKKILIEDKKLKLFPGLYHEMFNEVEKDRTEVLGEVSAWLKPRIA